MHRTTLPGGLSLSVRALAVCALAACALAGCVPVGEKPAPSTAVGDAQRGLRLLSQYQCGSCHAIAGVPSARGRVGPVLDGFGRRSYIAGRLPNRADVLALWIADPQSLVPGTTMPDMGVPPEAARDMAAWLLEPK